MSTPAPTPLRSGFSEMSSSVYSPVRTGFREKRRVSIGLPTSSVADRERLPHRYSRPVPWTAPLSIPIPGVRARGILLPMPNPSRFRQAYASYSARRRGSSCLFIGLFAAVFTLFIFVKPLHRLWPWSHGKSTLVFQREDLQRIWTWEIESGHYPSSHPIPYQIGLSVPPWNPALMPSNNELWPGPVFTNTIGVGPKRDYLDIQNHPPDVGYPARPVPGSVADLDVVMEHCDFSQQKYVRDCLEVLRLGGGLESNGRLRRGSIDEWKYVYLERGERDRFSEAPPIPKLKQAVLELQSWYSHDPNDGLNKKRGAEWETPLRLPESRPHHPYVTLPGPCDDENPRIFHMFWAGPFTDKPYTALLSFLFTQNTRLHVHEGQHASPVCRPQIWMWINPGPAASVPNPSAMRDMYDQLKDNPWASPFLHSRFHDVVKFKLWNTTEQLDGVPELKDEWRILKDTMFNSGGHILNVSHKKQDSRNGTASNSKSKSDDMVDRAGTKSSSSMDKLSTVLSDMARFVLCHRFGGVYLDADNILLRDWEELWGWKGAFAYRWSRLPDYNTAVLRMTKGSALGSFLFRTALRNGLDFHPMTVTRYTRDAHLQGLLLRLPDALFDPAWLNTENYQRDRPPQPYFTSFDHFFDTPTQDAAAPSAVGFDGFFKGAYSYHYHNSWWKPFDSSRNWPDLGPRFIAGERKVRAAAGIDDPMRVDQVNDDKRDLDWATVLKRTFEAYIRGERPNMYGEWIVW